MLQTDMIKSERPGSRWLLVALHGLGDSMEGYRWVPRELRFPELNYLLVNAPDAYYGGFSWYDFAADPGPGVERSYRALEQLLDQLQEQGFPAAQTFLFGFSQGCLMTIETGLRYSKRLAGCIGVSGYVHEPERLLKQMSPAAREQQFLITHGTHDGLLPVSRVRGQIEMLRREGIQLEYHEFAKDHTFVESELDLFRAFIQPRLQPARLPQPTDKAG